MPNISFSRVTVNTPGTSVLFPTQPPDNCDTLLVTNPSATETVYVGFVTVPEALVPGVNSQRVFPLSVLTLGIGSVPQRDTITNLAVDATGTVTPEVSYVKQLG